MKETKFTGGTWVVSGCDQVVSMPSQCKIANSVSGWSYEEAKANAKLIAAAPDLLEALENLVHLHGSEMEGLQSGKPTMQQWLDAVDKASEAIRKATE